MASIPTCESHSEEHDEEADPVDHPGAVLIAGSLQSAMSVTK